MLKNLKNRKKQEGFTIIEVLIVLAIAGLIIAIVLFAVPALQRNGRNTAIKNDAGIVAGQIADYETNNDGAFPTGVVAAAGTGLLTVSGTGTQTTGKVQSGTTVSVVAAAPAAPTAAAPSPATGTISVLLGHKCTVAGVFTPGTIGDVATRAASIYYSIETSGNTIQKCVDS